MLRVVLFIASLVVISISCQGQSIAIEFSHSPNRFGAYKYVKNPLNIIVENYSCDALEVEVKYGSIKKDSLKPCGYLFDPLNTVKQDSLFVYKKLKNGKELIQTITIDLQWLPLVAGVTGAYNGDFINKEDLVQFPLLFRVEALNTNFNISIPIDTFAVSIVRNGKMKYRNMFARESDFTELIQEFKKLSDYDIVRFYYITYKRNDGKVNYAPTLTVIVNNAVRARFGNKKSPE